MYINTNAIESKRNYIAHHFFCESEKRTKNYQCYIPGNQGRPTISRNGHGILTSVIINAIKKYQNIFLCLAVSLSIFLELTRPMVTSTMAINMPKLCSTL